MVGMFKGLVAGVVSLPPFNNRPARGRIDLLVDDRDSKALMKIYCDTSDIPRIQTEVNKTIEVPVDVSDYFFEDDTTTGEVKRGISFKLWKPAK